MRRPPLLPLMLATTVAALSGCSFGDMTALVPSYACTSSAECSVGTCIEQVCAEAESTGYQLVLRVEGPVTDTETSATSFTFDPLERIDSGSEDIVFPPSRIVYGRVRHAGDFVVETQISFARESQVAALVDEVRATSSASAAVGDDGGASDFRAYVPSSVGWTVRFAPTVSPTPGAAVIPSEFAGMPLASVFPPLEVEFPPSGSTDPTRLDVSYGPSLFDPCTQNSQTPCSVTGRLLSMNGASSGPEAGVAIDLVDARGRTLSTTAVSAADGSFRLRVGDPTRELHFRIRGSSERPAVPELELETGTDPRLGGDLVIPRFQAIRVEGRVERLDSLVADATVRAVATTIFDASGVAVPGARFETTVRSTDATAADGAGLFALGLPRGRYDVVASETSAASSLVYSDILASPLDSATTIRGVTLALGRPAPFDGVVRGPDGRPMPYATVQAFPATRLDARGGAEAYARSASTTSDASGGFVLSTDRGVFDLVLVPPPTSSLPTFVLTDLPIDASGIAGREFTIPAPVVRTGRITDPDGAPRPFARITAYFSRPPAIVDVDRPKLVLLAQATADSLGNYRLLVPSRIASP